MKKLSIILIALFSGSYVASAEINVIGLKVQSMTNPIGIGIANPQFSWQWQSSTRGTLQSAYEIMAATTAEKLNKGDADTWKTGMVESAAQTYIEYSGSTLQSCKTYYWKVRIRDKSGKVSPWSEAANFTTGILSATEWSGKWITFDTTKAKALPIFRKVFSVDKKVSKAIACISGLGYGELYFNGKKTGDHVLDPGQTNYDDYALYSCYDATPQLKSGANVIGIMLGDGWYNQNKVWGKNGLSYGNPLLIFQLDIEFADGSKELVVSDQSWQWADGPIITSNVYAGEVYNAQKEISGWSSDPNARAEWHPVIPAGIYPPGLAAQSLPPIKKMKELPAKRVTQPAPDTYIFDFGQNFAGWTRLNVNAPAGTTITIRTAEELDNEGKLNIWSTGVTATKVEQTEVYTCKGSGTEIWEPRFTYHGFRYAEVTGLSAKPDLGLLTGIVVYSSVGEAGNFACSDEQLNKLHKLALWTFTSNIHSIPTDCPAREKCGWLGDAHAMVQMGIYNFGIEDFWIKYLYDIRSTSRNEARASVYKTWNNQEQRIKPAGIPYMIAPGKRLGGAASPDWGTALVQIPWYVYLYYGNLTVLKEFYPDMKRWTDYIEGFAVDHIVDYGLGDWCPPGMIVPTDTPVKISSSAYHYLDLKIMEQAALLLGYKEDADRFKKTREATKEAFINAFYDKGKKTFGSQTSNSMALDFGLAPTGEEKAVSDAIVRISKEKLDGFMNTGIFGIARIFKALSRNGNEKAAISILDKKGYNSFEYMWSKYHATTLWEILPVDSFYLKMKSPRSDRSHSHPMQGGYDTWFYECVAGISPDPKTPGFKKIILNPGMISEIKWEKCSYDSPYGTIKSDWQIEGGQFKWHVTVPANTTAVLYMPAGSEKEVKEGGTAISKVQGIRFLENEGGRSLIEIGSGDYNFTAER
jgi:alpha-L-rhamnosidase